MLVNYAGTLPGKDADAPRVLRAEQQLHDIHYSVANYDCAGYFGHDDPL